MNEAKPKTIRTMVQVVFAFEMRPFQRSSLGTLSLEGNLNCYLTENEERGYALYSDANNLRAVSVPAPYI